MNTRVSVQKDLHIDGETRIAASSAWRWPISYRSIKTIGILGDIAIILVTSILSGAVYQSAFLGQDVEFARFLGAGAVVMALFVTTMKSRGLYDPNQLLNWNAQARNLIVTWLGVFLFLAGIVFALKIGKTFSRGATLSFAAAGLTALLLHRAVWRVFIRKALVSGKLGRRKALVIGQMASGPRLSSELERNGFKVDRQIPLPVERPSKQQIEDALTYAVEYASGSDTEEIFLVADENLWRALKPSISILQSVPLPVNLVPDSGMSELIRRPWHQIGESIAVELQRAPLNTTERVSKRCVDIALASAALILLLPLLLITAIAIKLDSPGPILFRQNRHGFNGRPFKIYKFRTMTCLEDGTVVQQAVRGDQRVTRIGMWLRRTSIDELPQLINVVRGEMSLVGPRPHAIAHNNHYSKLISNYAFRHHVKPGITGWAQINGCRGETPTLESMQERVEHDIWYIDNWSLLLDLSIMLRTATSIVRGDTNAY